VGDTFTNPLNFNSLKHQLYLSNKVLKVLDSYSQSRSDKDESLWNTVKFSRKSFILIFSAVTFTILGHFLTKWIQLFSGFKFLSVYIWLQKSISSFDKVISI